MQGGAIRPWKSFENTGVASDVGVGAISSNPVTQPLAQGPVSVPPLKAQTATTWDDHQRETSKPSFAKGIAVGVGVSLVAIGGTVALVAPRLKTPPPPISASSLPPVSESAPVPSSVASSIVSAEPPPAPSPAPATSVEPPKPGTKRRKTPVAPAPPPAPAPVEPPKVEPAKTPDSPNGAPILR